MNRIDDSQVIRHNWYSRSKISPIRSYAPDSILSHINGCEKLKLPLTVQSIGHKKLCLRVRARILAVYDSVCVALRPPEISVSIHRCARVQITRFGRTESFVLCCNAAFRCNRPTPRRGRKLANIDASTVKWETAVSAFIAGDDRTRPFTAAERIRAIVMLQSATPSLRSMHLRERCAS